MKFASCTSIDCSRLLGVEAVVDTCWYCARHADSCHIWQPPLCDAPHYQHCVNWSCSKEVLCDTEVHFILCAVMFGSQGHVYSTLTHLVVPWWALNPWVHQPSCMIWRFHVALRILFLLLETSLVDLMCCCLYLVVFPQLFLVFVEDELEHFSQMWYCGGKYLFMLAPTLLARTSKAVYKN